MNTVSSFLSRPSLILAVVLAGALAASALAASALAQPVALDPTFGDGGYVLIDSAGVGAVAVGPDGSLVAPGVALRYVPLDPPPYPTAAAWRFHADGTPDLTFGDGGRARATACCSGAEGSGFADLAVLPSGAVIAVGGVSYVTGNASLIARVLPDGTFDPAFGMAGLVIGPTAGGFRASNVAAEGTIVAAGTFSPGRGSGGGCTAVRYHTDGTLDEAFGEGGSIIVTPDLAPDQDFRCNDAAIDADGRFVFAATATVYSDSGPSDRDVLAIRLLDDGTRDPAFGTDGVAVVDLPSLHSAETVAVSADGSITIGGVVINQSQSPVSHLLVRLTSDGGLDPTFGSDGIAEVEVGSGLGDGYLEGLLVEADGGVIVSGGAYLYRVHPDGTVDYTFGPDGVFITNGYVLGITLDAEGRIVVSGLSYDEDTGTQSGFIARLLTNGAVAADPAAHPERIALGVPFPNPVTGRTALTFTLPDPAPVRLAVYDMLGREVAVVSEGTRGIGTHTATLDTARLPSGLYVVRLTAGGDAVTRQLTVVR